MLVTSIGKMVIDHVKQSEEIQRLFATEHEKCADMAKANYVNANLNERNITCDVYYYAKDDEWVRTISYIFYLAFYYLKNIFRVDAPNFKCNQLATTRPI